ncbi:MAG: hypothetical protein IJC90_06710 [Clostridia bacterium]|nr:hypothetical protein [Clostridia bacterium]
MSCWGMGITQSDEYCEIYERFMEEYDEGKPLADIKADILEEYLEEFEADDGVLHDVYFALGKAEWMCGGISDDIFEKIKQIIESDANIEFYRELEATEKDLKLRKKNLEKFLTAISLPRGKIKKRKTPVEKYVKVEKPKLPAFHCCDVFAYNVQNKYRIVCFVTREKFFNTYASYCYAFEKLYEKLPAIDDLRNEYVIPLGYFTVGNFPAIEKFKLIGNMGEFQKLNVTFPYVIYDKWKPATFAIAKENNLTEEYPHDLCLKVSDVIKKAENLRPAILED